MTPDYITLPDPAAATLIASRLSLDPEKELVING
jgi:hypothetical protein